MDNTKSSTIVNLYKNIIKSQNQMKISHSLTQIIKGYIELSLKPLMEKRSK